MKNKKVKPAPKKTWEEAGIEYADMADKLRNAFLLKRFTIDQSFQLTLLFIQKAAIPTEA